MSTLTSEVKEWSDALVHAAQELATTTLGFTDIHVVGPCEQVPLGSQGSNISLIHGGYAVNLGLSMGTEEARSVAQAFLAMEDGEELDEEDVRDATGELVNILAGSVKSKLSSSLGPIQLGLPTFLCGRVHALHDQQLEVVELRLGEVSVYLSTLKAQDSGAAS